MIKRLSWRPSMKAKGDHDHTVTNRLGLTLVRNVVESQLKGRLTRTIQDATLVVAIDVPDVVQCEGD